MTNLTPKQIVDQLNKHVVGQEDAKRSVAISLRNRWRRQNVEPKELRDEIYPHNILMVGPTGVGKTEIARRLAKLVEAPFIKVEATKFTEIGYVGRDVDSIIRDLTETSITMTRHKLYADVAEKAKTAAEAKIINILVGESASNETKSKFYIKLAKGVFDSKEIEVEISDNPTQPNMPTFDVPGGQMGVMNLSDMLGSVMGGKKTKTVKMTVADALEALQNDESDKLIDPDKLSKEAIKLVENNGIVFIDEIDKIAAKSSSTGSKGEVSREGVQRDLLPLIEGSTISTKYGPVKSDHILFIASGAFHIAKPSDLLPELQGRLPIRVELKALSENDFIDILKEPTHNLIKQYTALFDIEKVTLKFVDSGIKEIAKISAEINREVENIGARRLHTILEKLLESLNFTASDTPGTKVTIDKKYVQKHLADLVKNQDLSKFIL